MPVFRVVGFSQLCTSGKVRSALYFAQFMVTSWLYLVWLFWKQKGLLTFWQLSMNSSMVTTPSLFLSIFCSGRKEQNTIQTSPSIPSLDNLPWYPHSWSCWRVHQPLFIGKNCFRAWASPFIVIRTLWPTPVSLFPFQVPCGDQFVDTFRALVFSSINWD